MTNYGPQVLAERVGLQWPTAGAFGPASSPRASSPRLDQGGTLETLMQGIWQPRGHSPHNRFSTVVVLASANAFANPTTPAPAVADRRPSVAPATVPSAAASADAWSSQVPAAPTRPVAGRGWSAYADDRGRSAFPLEPPSFAPKEKAATRPSVPLDDLAVVLQPVRLPAPVSRAWRRR